MMCTSLDCPEYMTVGFGPSVVFFFFKAIYSVNCNTDGGDNSNNFLTKFECMFAKSARFHKLDK